MDGGPARRPSVPRGNRGRHRGGRFGNTGAPAQRAMLQENRGGPQRRAGYSKRGSRRGARWGQRQYRGAASAGQNLIEFKRGLCGNEQDETETMSQLSGCTGDWPDDESEECEEHPEREEPAQCLSQELEHFEDLTDEVPAIRKARMGFVSVFWDIENCAVPTNVSAYAIVKKVRDRFYKQLREADFVVACDILNMKAKVTEELNNAHVTVIHVSTERKNSADEKLRVRLRRFADQHQLSGSTIVLISGDVDFAAELHEMRYHNLIHVVLVHNDQARKELVDVANESYRYSSFVEDLKPKGSTSGGGPDPAMAACKGSSKKAVPPKEKKPSCNKSTESTPGDLSGSLSEAGKATKVGLRIPKELGNLVFWKGYLAGVVPPEFVLKVHLPNVLHLIYPSANKAKKACATLTKLREADANAPVRLGIVDEEKQTPVAAENLQVMCIKKVQKATKLQRGRIDTCRQLLDGIGGDREKGQLAGALRKQLSIYEAQMREFLSATESLRQLAEVEGTVQEAQQKMTTEAKRLETGFSIYAAKSDLLRKATRNKLRCYLLFLDRGKVFSWSPICGTSGTQGFSSSSQAS